jgi:tRNA(adenine34) deaminase
MWVSRSDGEARVGVHDETDRAFMGEALALARAARLAGEVPVGAVVVVDGVIVGSGHNASIARTDPTAHAEVLAIRDAAARIGNYRLVGATLYGTVEPCLMCVGAMLHARIGRLVYGAAESRVSATSRLEDLRGLGASINHRFETVGGVRAGEAASLLLEFFRERRVDRGAKVVDALG